MWRAPLGWPQPWQPLSSELQGWGYPAQCQPLPREPDRPRVHHLRPPLVRPRPLVEVFLQHRCLEDQLRALYQFGQGPLLLQCLFDPHAQVPVHADPHGAALAALLLCQPPDLLNPVARLALCYEAQASLDLKTFDVEPRLPELLAYLLQGGQPWLF